MQYGNGGADRYAKAARRPQAPNPACGAAASSTTTARWSIGGAFQYNEQARGRNLNDYAWSIAASYQFPKLKIGAVYEKMNYDCWTGSGLSAQLSNCFNNATTGLTPFNGAQKTELTRNMFGVGVTWDIGPGQLYFDWSWAQEGKGSAVTDGCKNGTVACARVGGLAGGGDGGANQYEVSYTYPLSKRTSVWAGYKKIANECAGLVQLRRQQLH